MEALPLAFAFTAGMVATVNPCGFAMVPVYLSMILTGAADNERPWLGGLRLGGWVTVGFLAVFTLVGGVVAAVSSRVLQAMPWVALLLGVTLVAYGVVVLRGRGISLPSLDLRFAKTVSRRGLVVFGGAYGIASLSCTLPVFLAVAGAATAAPNLVAGAGVYSVYGLGMGVVLTAVAVAVATSRDSVVRRIRQAGRYLDRIGGWMLVAAGLFIVYYWATALAVSPTADGSPWLVPSKFVTGISARLQSSIGANPWVWAGSAIGVILAFALAETLRRRSRPSGEQAGERDQLPDPTATQRAHTPSHENTSEEGER